MLLWEGRGGGGGGGGEEEGSLTERHLAATSSVSLLQSKAKLVKKQHPKKRGQRATSNIFAMFDQAQIQEFKEVWLCVERLLSQLHLLISGCPTPRPST